MVIFFFLTPGKAEALVAAAAGGADVPGTRPGELLVCLDQVVRFGDVVLEKPHTPEKVREFYALYNAGRNKTPKTRIEFVNGMCLYS